MDRSRRIDSLPVMSNTAMELRIDVSPETELSALDRAWLEEESDWSEEECEVPELLHEPRMFGFSGRLTASGGDFGFELPPADPNDSARK